MLKCPWCGKEYPDGQEFCTTDHTALQTPGPDPAPAKTESGPEWKPKPVDLSQIEGAFDFEEGYSRPDWRIIREAIKQQVTDPDDLETAWGEAARQWAMRIRSDLGGDYRVKDSPQFILLSALDSETSGIILNFVERTLDHIQAKLGDAAWKSGKGKHVILLFTDKDDYYQYVSYFHRDGIHPTSGGCLISSKGYVHIAAPYEASTNAETLAHELAHNCVVHLRLPLWLNEGLAQHFQREAVAGSGRRSYSDTILDFDLKERHLAFWNPKNIQEFWSGISFQTPGDSNQLSYSLAEIMLVLLSEKGGDFGEFVKQSRWDDAGQTAAMDCLDADLGVVMSTFLGEGDWHPRRKAMLALWEAQKKETDPD